MPYECEPHYRVSDWHSIPIELNPRATLSHRYFLKPFWERWVCCGLAKAWSCDEGQPPPALKWTAFYADSICTSSGIRPWPRSKASEKSARPWLPPLTSLRAAAKSLVCKARRMGPS
jgi:hypothetical protein